MPIIHHDGGGTTVTGDAINFLQLVSQRGAVKLESVGLRVTRGRKLWPMLAQHYGIKGQGKKKPTVFDVLAWLEAKVAEMRPLQEDIDGATGRRTVGGQDVQ